VLLGERAHGRTPIREQLLTDLEAMNASPEQLAKFQAKAGPGDNAIGVEPENWNVFRLFRQMHRSQWRRQTVVAGRNIATRTYGLEFSALAPIASALCIELSEELLDQLREMEDQALTIFDKRMSAALSRR
jgi:hypothetical protein